MGRYYLNDQEMLKVIAKYSPKSLHELMIFECSNSLLSTQDLESFFISWGNRLQKRLTLILCKDQHRDDSYERFTTIIEKYKKLGIVKEFRIEDYNQCLLSD